MLAQAWFEHHFRRCSRDARTSLQALSGQPGVPAPVQHLLCTSTSLRQAGGQHRMVLRGHTAAVRHLAISSDGRDVLTASDDGTVQVGGGGTGAHSSRGWRQWRAGVAAYCSRCSGSSGVCSSPGTTHWPLCAWQLRLLGCE